MKHTIEYRLDLRTPNGLYIATEEHTEIVQAINADDAMQIIFDKYEGTPHSVHIEHVKVTEATT
jgi:hypothetical protein